MNIAIFKIMARMSVILYDEQAFYAELDQGG